MSAIEKKIEDLTRPVIEGEGFALVKVRVSDGVVEIMAEDPATRNLLVDDAAKLSREISAHLDVEDPISGAYRLEVSSPGIDRPLVALKDYVDYAGFEAKIECKTPDEIGQKRFRGRIEGVNKTIISVSTDQGPKDIDFENIAKAKLVLSDELIQKTAKKHKGEN